MIFIFISAFIKILPGHDHVRSFLSIFQDTAALSPPFPPANTAKTDMSVSEVSIPKNGILALARGSHLRRVFPVPRDYL